MLSPAGIVTLALTSPVPPAGVTLALADGLVDQCPNVLPIGAWSVKGWFAVCGPRFVTVTV